jgi:hypothetical protein
MPIEVTAPESAPRADVLAIPLRLEGVFAEWLRARAQAHGESPEEHAARLMRAYWAHHDTWRHQGAPSAPREGAP